MFQRVALQEMILTAIAAQLQLGPYPERCARIASFPDGLLGPGQVALEIHRPLIQTTCRQLHHPHLPDAPQPTELTKTINKTKLFTSSQARNKPTNKQTNNSSVALPTQFHHRQRAFELVSLSPKLSSLANQLTDTLTNQLTISLIKLLIY